MTKYKVLNKPVLLSKCLITLDDNKGFVSVFSNYNMETNELLDVSYSYQPQLFCDHKEKVHFNATSEKTAFQLLNEFLDTLENLEIQ